MCGFAGYAGEREYDTSVIRKMTDKIGTEDRTHKMLS